MDNNAIRSTDPILSDLLDKELKRQRETLALIASENHVSKSVLQAQGSILTNKYAEGYPGSRYYGGCEHVDAIEQLAIDRAKEIWNCEYANVQPHSGTQANMGVYFAVLNPGDKILSMSLTHGGHLSHGHPANFSGRFYEIRHYEVDHSTGYIDYESMESIAKEFKPDMIVSGFSAYPRIVEWKKFHEVAEDIGAYHLADMAHITGLVAGGQHPSPMKFSDFVTGSTHKTIRSGRGGIILCDDPDYISKINTAVMPGMQGGPLLHNIAGKAAGFAEALTPEFSNYASHVVANAKSLCNAISEGGLKIVSGGTDTHIVLVDLRDSHPDLTGKEVSNLLESVNMVLNANTVPGETRSPFLASGIRIGTPAITTRGFTETDCKFVGELIVKMINNPHEDATKSFVLNEIKTLCEKYPLYL
jgi:glycine hydroxymethyltransferase